MRILVITQYFEPEPGAPSHRLVAFVDAMVSRGHDVTVICEFPNYPEGRLSPEDRFRLFRVEKKGSYKTIRTFVLTFGKKNNLKRMLSYLSFALSSFIAALVLSRRDITFSSSPPIFQAYMAMLAARIKRSKFIADIRDIWPDSATEVEAVSNKRLLRYGGYIERQLYENATTIFTTTKGSRKLIASRGGQEKTFICYNGSFEKVLDWRGDAEAIRRANGWAGKTVVTYAGLIGLGQNLIDLLPEIQTLNRENLRFLFVGDGPQKKDFVRKIEEIHQDNVIVLKTMAMKDVLPFLYASDILLVLLRESDFFKKVIPSKFFDYMAIGKPILSNVDGELREIMECSGSGDYFSIREPGSFANAVHSLARDPARREEMGISGKRTVAEKFMRHKLATEAVKTMEQRLRIG